MSSDTFEWFFFQFTFLSHPFKLILSFISLNSCNLNTMAPSLDMAFVRFEDKILMTWLSLFLVLILFLTSSNPSSTSHPLRLFLNFQISSTTLSLSRIGFGPLASLSQIFIQPYHLSYPTLDTAFSPSHSIPHPTTNPSPLFDSVGLLGAGRTRLSTFLTIPNWLIDWFWIISWLLCSKNSCHPLALLMQLKQNLLQPFYLPLSSQLVYVSLSLVHFLSFEPLMIKKVWNIHQAHLILFIFVCGGGGVLVLGSSNKT